LEGELDDHLGYGENDPAGRGGVNSRDMDFDNDRSQVRTLTGPASWPARLAMTILRLAGATCIAAALRYHARRPARPRQTIMFC